METKEIELLKVQGELKKYATKLTRSKYLAMDLLQDTNLRILDREYRSEGKMIAYAMFVMYSTFINDYRYAKRSEKIINNIPNNLPNDRKRIPKELTAAIRQEKKEIDRIAFVCRKLGLKDRETSEIFGVKQSTLRGAVHRLKKKFSSFCLADL